MDRFESQPTRQPAAVNRMPSAIQPTATPLRPIYDLTSRNFSPTKSSTINDREPVINSSFKGTKFKHNLQKETSSLKGPLSHTTVHYQLSPSAFGYLDRPHSLRTIQFHLSPSTLVLWIVHYHLSRYVFFKDRPLSPRLI